MIPFPVAHWGAPFEGPLDPYTTNLWGAYSITRLLSSYTGDLLRVRRSSDDTEQDIGYESDGTLDSAALAAFVGANNGFVVTWYDQSGGSKDLTQATTTRQPMLVSAGTILEFVEWDGSNDTLASGNSGTPTAFSVYIAGRNRKPVQGANNSYAQLFGRTEALVYHLRETVNAAIVDTYCCYQTISGSNYQPVEFSLQGQTFAFVFDRAQATVALEAKTYANGSLPVSHGTTGSAVTGNFTAAAWSFGSESAGTNAAKLAAKSIAIYETAHDATAVGNVTTALTPPETNLDVFDALTSNLWAVCGMRRLRSTYAGSCLRVRRTSDNAESDIGFTAAGVLDTAAVLAFTGNGSDAGRIKTWYDQSGNGNNFTESTAAKQPAIAHLGVVFPGADFDGSTGANAMISVNNSGTPSAFTVLMHADMFDKGSGFILLEQSADANANTGCLVGWDSAGQRMSFYDTTTTGANRAGGYCNIAPTSQIVAARWDRSQGTGAAQAVLFNGGTKLTRDASLDQGVNPSGNFSAVKWYLGARGESSIYFNGQIFSFAIYESAVSDANIETLSRALG